MSHAKEHLQQLAKDVIDEPNIWDLEPKFVRLRWSSISAAEIKKDTTMEKMHEVLYEKKASRFRDTYLTRLANRAELGRRTAESSHCTVQRRQKNYRSTDALCRKTCKQSAAFDLWVPKLFVDRR